LPSIHCQGCIAGVEEALQGYAPVRSARVNLTLRRVLIDAEPGTAAVDLIEVLRASGYDAHELDMDSLGQTETDRIGKDLLMRLAVAGFASMNVMLLSVAVWSGAADATRDLFHWLSAAIAVPAVAFSAKPFFVNAKAALGAGRLNMDVPISLAILLALGSSLWETSLSGEHAYFDAALTLTFFLLAGRWLDARTRAAARSAAEELTALEVPRALRRQGGNWVEAPVSQVSVGDQVLVRPGGRVPVDGVIVDGISETDRALLTGETLPHRVQEGDPVSAGEVNLSGPLIIRATAVGRDTSLHQLAALVALAEGGRARYTSLADRAAKLYAPGVHILSALAFAGWWLWSGDLRLALNIAAAVLIITCPCALGLAVPAVTTAASGRLFRKGVLIKNATALERMAEVDTVVFDKTGTLTQGVPELLNWRALEPEVQSIALGLAQGSNHPLSKAIVVAARAVGTSMAQIDQVVEIPGQGVSGRYAGQEVRLGRLDWLGATEEAAGLAVALRIGDGAAQVLRFSDAPRAGAAEVIQQLRASHIRVALVSGDRAEAVGQMAKRLGIDDWHAGASPEDKAKFVQNLQASGRRVMMVGDGLNDTAALAGAHVSISPASALDAARVASDIVLLGLDLTPIADSLHIARRATRRIKENFRIATFYNVIAVPLAIAGLATPLIAALAMSSSSIIVSLNALRLGRQP
jgi:Cu2+-exporting ATPase